MPRIFISYRRSDTPVITGRLHDYLIATFGEDNVFKDVDSIPAGADFRAELNRAVGSSDVLLVMIGPKWLADNDGSGKPRLFDPDDFVRIEAEHALTRRDILVIPVLAQNAPMPSAQDLPESLQELAYRNATILRDDPDFRRDASKLIERIQEYFASKSPVSTKPARAANAGQSESPNPSRNIPAMPQAAPPPVGAPDQRSFTQRNLIMILIVGAVVIFGLCMAIYVCGALIEASNYGYTF